MEAGAEVALSFEEDSACATGLAAAGVLVAEGEGDLDAMSSRR